MAADNPRIEELRRRVLKDPASIAFAQLGEELRRAGEFEDAIQVCRTGLEQHPGYLSARVTLGRALLETSQYDDAQTELEYVLRAAPDNLAAIRALADIHQRREEGDSGGDRRSGIGDQSLEAPPPIPAAPVDDALLDLALRGSGGHTVFGSPIVDPDPALDTFSDLGALPDLEAFPELGTFTDSGERSEPEPTPDPGSPIPDPRSPAPDPRLIALESWLAAIVADRARLRASRFGGARRT